MSILNVNNVTKRFKDKLVLDNVSFKVEEGEIFGLLGPNGAGKSTLINIMSSLLNGDGGVVEIGGYNIDKEPIKAKEILGVVPQDLALMENLSAYDNLEFFGALYGLRGKVLKERINEALEVTGLLDRKKEKVKKFSGGMKRRLNIAAAIMHKPRVLIMDEPTVGVDPQSRNHIFEFTKRICREQKTTVIYTSHYMEEIEELCSRVFIMDLGQEVAYGTLEDVKNSVFTNKKVVISLTNKSGQVIRLLQNVNGVVDLKEGEEEIRLSISEEFKLGEALTLLEAAGCIITKINYEEPRLEDVFLALTGKSLRD
ncbi:MAG: ATP-binding cassette domain-containing protein [Clostridium sp.]